MDQYLAIGTFPAPYILVSPYTFNLKNADDLQYISLRTNIKGTVAPD
jgi:hypothetical protein